MSNDVKITQAAIRICQDCINLKGSMCHNPACVFCRRTMREVQEMLDLLQLCPIVDGKRHILIGRKMNG